MLREFYGRGPMKAKTYALDDIIVIVMRDSGYSAIEQTMMDAAEPERVVDMREDLQRVMKQRYIDTIQKLTGRNVVAFISQAHVEPDLTLEIFFIDRPLDGFGAIEIIDPEPPPPITADPDRIRPLAAAWPGRLRAVTQETPLTRENRWSHVGVQDLVQCDARGPGERRHRSAPRALSRFLARTLYRPHARRRFEQIRATIIKAHPATTVSVGFAKLHRQRRSG